MSHFVSAESVLVAGSAEGEKRVPALAKCIKELPKVNYQVLKTLLIHLRK